MANFTPTDAQARAIVAIEDWYKNRVVDQQVFRLFGYAGTGKSTLVSHVIAELGLDGSSEGVVNDTLYGTFTGKAAYVLRKKGVPCRTIHSLIYSVSEATDEEIAKARQELVELEVAARQASGGERIFAEAMVVAKRSAIREMREPKWRLNQESDVRDCKLLVLDEVSMVGDEMAADLLSFQKPILVLGDPGQLPPIRGTGAFTMQEPDVMLTEIHRQAAESAIIRVATMARQGEHIPYGQHDEFVWKLHRRDVTAPQLLRADQVICGRNATRLDLNNGMRRAAGFGNELPEGPDDKVICLKNDHSLGLINGMFLSLDEVSPINEERFSSTITTEEGVKLGRPRSKNRDKFHIYAGHFADHVRPDPEREERDWRAKKTLVEATFGYAITCHKAQGSQFENVIVWDDHLGRSQEDRARWLYTAITRAETGLVLLD